MRECQKKLTLLWNSHGPNEDGDGENLQVLCCMVEREWHVRLENC
jgi:hypothetical protein